jgi:lysozyme
MDDVMRLRMVAQLTRDEGRRNRMYLDSVGAWTIGVGHNLRDRGISDRAIDVILEDDLLETEKELIAGLPWVTDLAGARYGVLLNMCFNLGIGGLMGFKDMLAAVQAGAWDKAADAMRDSVWATQVGARASRLERQMVTGEW